MSLTTSLRSLAFHIDGTVAGVRALTSGLAAARARLEGETVAVDVTVDDQRPPGFRKTTGRVFLPVIDWDQFDRDVLAQWRRNEAAWARNPRAAIFVARHDDPRLIGGGRLRPRDWLALALVLGARG